MCLLFRPRWMRYSSLTRLHLGTNEQQAQLDTSGKRNWKRWVVAFYKPLHFGTFDLTIFSITICRYKLHLIINHLVGYSVVLWSIGGWVNFNNKFNTYNTQLSSSKRILWLVHCQILASFYDGYHQSKKQSNIAVKRNVKFQSHTFNFNLGV